MKPKLAVIGSGIAGMGAAYYLRDVFDVHMYEVDNYIGGHTNTRFVKQGVKDLPIDTGFMVFNDHTYPNLLRLFAELEVTSYPTSMSFGVRNEDSGLEYSSQGGAGFFAQRWRIADPRQWSLFRGIKRFFKIALERLESDGIKNLTLGEFAKSENISARVLNDFVIPMAAAIWSTPPAGILEFPARPLLRFMENHHMLGIGIQYQWRTVEGGSEQYKRKLLSNLPNQPLSNYGAKQIVLSPDHATIFFENGDSGRFDHVIIATHADDALKLLTNPTDAQYELLSAFGYNTNTAVLHSDERVMPRSRSAWASWNVSHRKKGNSTRSATHYWMNSLQNIDTEKNYFVSIDAYDQIPQEHIHWHKTYTHPRYDGAALDAQPKLHTLNEEGPVSFCGSYFRNGFHEDALWSSVHAVNSLLKRKESRHELLPV